MTIATAVAHYMQTTISLTFPNLSDFSPTNVKFPKGMTTVNCFCRISHRLDALSPDQPCQRTEGWHTTPNSQTAQKFYYKWHSNFIRRPCTKIKRQNLPTDQQTFTNPRLTGSTQKEGEFWLSDGLHDFGLGRLG